MGWCRGVIFFLFAFVAVRGVANAQDLPSSEEIVEKLRTPSAGLGKGSAPPASGLSQGQRSVIDSTLGKSALGKQITVEERRVVDGIVEEANLPAMDLSVNFTFNSAELKPDAYGILMRLGAALSSKELAGSRFLVEGHTDSRGSKEYNQRLSEARAAAVVEFLVQSFGVDRSRVIPLGYGEEKLKNPSDGEAAENRRVEIVNLTI